MTGAIEQILEQGQYLVTTLKQEQYDLPVREAFGATIGAHYRHSLEHFQAVLDVDAEGVIDYDARARDEEIEKDKEAALRATKKLLAACRSLDVKVHDPVAVRCAVTAEGEDSPLVTSSYERECMYVIVHAIHHYALIACMCQLIDVPVPSGFGMAPSTQRHQRSLATHA